MNKIVELHLNEVETVTGGASRPTAAEMMASYSNRPTYAASVYRPATLNSSYSQQTSNMDAMIAQYMR